MSLERRSARESRRVSDVQLSDEAKLELVEIMDDYYDDPLGFVQDMFPWGVEGTPLERFTGPRKWQAEVLRTLGEEVRKRAFDGFTSVMPVYLSISSGHGIGKSALSAWIILWVVCTRFNSKGTVMANTSKQLSARTWAEVGKWRKYSVYIEAITKYKNSAASMMLYNWLMVTLVYMQQFSALWLLRQVFLLVC